MDFHVLRVEGVKSRCEERILWFISLRASQCFGNWYSPDGGESGTKVSSPVSMRLPGQPPIRDRQTTRSANPLLLHLLQPPSPPPWMAFARPIVILGDRVADRGKNNMTLPPLLQGPQRGHIDGDRLEINMRQTLLSFQALARVVTITSLTQFFCYPNFHQEVQ